MTDPSGESESNSPDDDRTNESAGPAEASDHDWNEQASGPATLSESAPDAPGSTAHDSDESSSSHTPDITPGRLVLIGILLETALVIVALGIAWYFDFYDHDHPLRSWFHGQWMVQVGLGALAALPLIWFVWTGMDQLPWLEDFSRFIHEKLGPLFRNLKAWQIVVISVTAGVGEEVFFRWCLQGGLSEKIGVVAALALTSLLFGAAHWLNTTYFVLATLLGAVLGWIYLIAGPLTVITCHAAYDAVGISLLVRDVRAASPPAGSND